MSGEDCGYCIRCDEAKRAKLTGAARLMRRFPLCPECGNKRCPKSTWHGNACSGSNESGQPGSDYGSREVTPEDRRRAVARDLLAHRSPLTITDGMRRALHPRQGLWSPRNPFGGRFPRSRRRPGSFRGVRRER